MAEESKSRSDGKRRRERRKGRQQQPQLLRGQQALLFAAASASRRRERRYGYFVCVRVCERENREYYYNQERERETRRER